YCRDGGEHKKIARQIVRAPRTRGKGPEGHRRASTGLGGFTRELSREPFRSPTHSNDAAGWPRRGTNAADAALGAGEGGRRLRRVNLRRAGHRKIAHRSDCRGADRRRAAHPPALFLLASPPGQRPLSKYRPTRTGGRLPPRGYP